MIKPHLQMINEALMDVAFGKNKRLQIHAGPRHGKSETCTKWNSFWHLGTFPHHRLGVVSYEAGFASLWGMKVRDLIEEWGPSLFGITVRPDHRAIDDFHIMVWDSDKGKYIDQGGGMVTCGIGGPLAGKGLDLMDIDDPIKNSEEAQSPTLREKHWDWMCSVAEERIEPGGGIIMPTTRWNEDDLAGRCIEAEPDIWKVLNFPSIAEENDILGRQPGEALWPERYPIEVLLQKKKRNVHWFNAVHQGHPQQREGGQFDEKWFVGKIIYRRDVPDHKSRIRWWDLAITKDDGDFTAGVQMWRGVDDNYYIIDVVEGQWAEHSRNQAIEETSEGDGKDHPIGAEEEPGSSGTEAGSAFVRRLPGYRVKTKKSTGSKQVRAQPFADQCEAGNVYLVKGHWNKRYIQQLAAFKIGCANDDLVDASSGAFNYLADAKEVGKPAWGGSRNLVLRTPGQFGRHPSFGRFGRIGRTG
jgi:predicted phage terminase large subunit-like protein